MDNEDRNEELPPPPLPFEPRTVEKREKDYGALFHSIGLIDKIIDGNMEDDTPEEQEECMRRNVRHLEIMLDKPDWGNENMNESRKAITRGYQYLDAVEQLKCLDESDKPLIKEAQSRNVKIASYIR